MVTINLGNYWPGQSRSLTRSLTGQSWRTPGKDDERHIMSQDSNGHTPEEDLHLLSFFKLFYPILFEELSSTGEPFQPPASFYSDENDGYEDWSQSWSDEEKPATDWDSYADAYRYSIYPPPSDEQITEAALFEAYHAATGDRNNGSNGATIVCRKQASSLA